MKRFRYRALVEFDQPARDGPGRQYPGGTRSLTVHARRIGQPSGHKYFPATIVQDDQRPPQPGEPVVVTITVTDDDAPSYFAPGQPFTIGGESTGRGIISRRVLADSGPG
jgi:hypothetical protein